MYVVAGINGYKAVESQGRAEAYEIVDQPQAAEIEQDYSGDKEVQAYIWFAAGSLTLAGAGGRLLVREETSQTQEEISN